MLKLVTDADVNGDLFKAIRHHEPELDIVRVQDVGLRTARDQKVGRSHEAEDVARPHAERQHE